MEKEHDHDWTSSSTDRGHHRTRYRSQPRVGQGVRAGIARPGHGEGLRRCARSGTVDVTEARVVPVQLDITNFDDVAATARDCSDVSLLVNNAGAMLLRPFLSAPDMSAARTEMETNYFGTLAMARAFAPVLGAAGGGSLANMLSVVSWYAPPFNASYCASKSAQWALTNALRVELRAQGTLVVGVHAGFIDTDMAAAVDDPKSRRAKSQGRHSTRSRRGSPKSWPTSGLAMSRTPSPPTRTAFTPTSSAAGMPANHPGKTDGPDDKKANKGGIMCVGS